MSINKVLKPIFFIGAPRSGTTLIFEIFSRHEQLSWLMNYSNFFPNTEIIYFLVPLLNNRFIDFVGKKKQYNSLGYFNKYKIRPDECYKFWAEHTPEVNFSRDFLLNKRASDTTVENLNKIIFKINKFQNKDRFTTKLTGPGRIEYLNSIFPDAIFIHIVRDGRSVVQSLMNVGFWKNKVSEPWFINGLTKKDMKIWEDSNKNPVILTTLLWNRIIDTTQAEAINLDAYKDRYLEIKYEDFISNPSKKLNEMFKFSNLNSNEQILSKCMDGINIISNMNKKFKSDFTDEIQNEINLILSDNLKKLNYM